jgi:tripartite motif-containing protein 71
MVYVADTQNHRIQKFTNNGAFVAFWGTQGNGIGQFSYPVAIDIDRVHGVVYVVDAGNFRVQKFDLNGAFLEAWPVSFSYAEIALDPTGQYVYMSTSTTRISKFTSTGTFVTGWQYAPSGSRSTNGGIAVGPSGDVYYGASYDSKVVKFSPTGGLLAEWSVNRPFGLSVDADERVYVSIGDAIRKYTADGGLLWELGTAGTGNGQFTQAEDLTTDTSGNLFVVDLSNRVQKFAQVPTEVRPMTWGRLKTIYR